MPGNDYRYKINHFGPTTELGCYARVFQPIDVKKNTILTVTMASLSRH